MPPGSLLAATAKIVPPIPDVPIGEMVAAGEAEIGFQQVSELSHFPGVDFVGPLPADIQEITVFASGVQVGAKQVEAARAGVKFLTAPAAAPAFTKRGLEHG